MYFTLGGLFLYLLVVSLSTPGQILRRPPRQNLLHLGKHRRQ